MTAITATLRCELVKPLDGDWDALGRTLRALQAPVHRVLNGVVTELELLERAGDKTHPRTAAYRLTRDLWAKEREAAADRVERGKPYTGDEMIADTVPGSAVVLGVAGAAYDRWAKWRKERWRGSMSLPTFRAPAPLFVTVHGAKLDPQDGSAVLTLKLTSGRGKGVRLVVRPYGPAGYADMRRLLEGDAKLGDVKLKEERHQGKRKWQVFIAHTFERREVKDGRTMALHRGVHSFLTAAVAKSDTGREAYTTVLETGDDILAHKRRYTARRRSLGQQGRQLGKGAKGRGQARRHERITKLQDAEARWVRSKCQEVAAHAVKLAKQRGVKRILLDDWSNPASDAESGDIGAYYVRSFPLAQLKESIAWAAKKAGMTVETATGEYESRDCPHCLHRHEAVPLRNDRQGKATVFRCEQCMLERNVDVIAAWNLLVRDGQASPLADAKKAAKRKAGRLKKGKKAA